MVRETRTMAAMNIGGKMVCETQTMAINLGVKRKTRPYRDNVSGTFPALC
jgi:hypothetical protein